MKILDVYYEPMLKLEWESALDGLTYSLKELSKVHDVELLCFCMPTEPPSTLTKENLVIKFVKNHDEMVKEILSYMPDRLLMNGVRSLFNLWLCTNPHFRGVWKAIYYHGGALVDSCFNYVNRVLVQTQGQKNRLQLATFPYRGEADEWISVVPFGSDPQVFKPMDVEKKYVLTYQGNFSSIKRNILAAETMVKIKGKHLLFGSPCSQHIINRCLRIQKEFPNKLVVEATRVPHNQVPSKLNSGMIGFLTGIEGGTRGLSEYVGCGIPIITFSDSNSIAEEVERTGCGLVVKSPSEVPMSVEEILSSYTQYSKNALSYATEELSSKIMHDRLRSALELEEFRIVDSK